MTDMKDGSEKAEAQMIEKMVLQLQVVGKSSEQQNILQ